MDQEKMLREDDEREARATAAVAVMPFGDANELLPTDGWKYSLENQDQILVRLKVDNSGFGTLNNKRFGSKLVEEVGNLSGSELR